MKWRGVSYDVGRVYAGGGTLSPRFDKKVVRRELEIIKNDLHCNAVRICGRDIARLMTAAEGALEVGLMVLLSPDLFERSQAQTLAYQIKAATAAKTLYPRWPDRLALCIGSELTLFMQGIVPGKTVVERFRHPSLKETVDQGKHNGPLNAYLAKASGSIRNVFPGPITYASLPWETVDWSHFDIAGVDHHPDERINDRYVAMLDPLFASGKPVVITEFGCRTYQGAQNTGTVGFGIVDYRSLVLHQMPLLGRFVRARLNGSLVRDEALQAHVLADTLVKLDAAGVAGAFVQTFVEPLMTFSEDPRYDLDMNAFSLVRTYPHLKHGARYPDMPWEPKLSFHAVADFYARFSEDERGKEGGAP